MLDETKFNKQYDLIKEKSKINRDIAESLRKNIKIAFDAYNSYINTAIEKNESYDEYLDLQKELMYGESRKALPFSNVFNGIRPAAHITDDNYAENSKKAQDLADKVESDNAVLESLLSRAQEAMRVSINSIKEYAARDTEINNIQAKLLEDLDSPWDFLNTVGKHN